MAGVKDDGSPHLIFDFCAWLPVIGILLLVTRYSPVFTAIVIDHHLKPRQAAAYMRGNVMRYATIWILGVMGVNCLGRLVIKTGLALLDPTSLAAKILVGAATSATIVGATAITASAAALVYDFLVHGGGPQPLDGEAPTF